jgi:nucleoside-diphosphate-sugar epimerase
MQMKTPAADTLKPGGRRRLGRPRLLIVGCGDIGLGIVSRLHGRFRIFAVTTSPERCPHLRAAGAVPMLIDLDRDRPLRLARLATRVIHLAPPGPSGRRDHRAMRLLAALRTPAGPLVYVSTTGVYGDRRGARVDETASPAPLTDRALRRLDAERRMRAGPWHGSVLRVPGIYGRHRLPLERLRQGLPVPSAQDDVLTNHIHADDLARACIAALFRAAPRRVYNVVDDSQLQLGQYLDLVADHARLPRPPRLPAPALRAALSPMQYSFMTESRRIANRRLKSELRIRLHYPTVREGISDALAPSAPEAGPDPKTQAQARGADRGNTRAARRD